MPSKWSRCVSIFTLNNWEDCDKYPDLLGACYNYLCEFIIESLVAVDFEIFSQNYKYLWEITLLYQEVSRKELLKIKEPYRQNVVLAVYSNPVIEYGEISGYAYILGEIICDDKWKNLVIETFEKSIEKMEGDNEKVCEKIASVLNIQNHLRPAIYNRYMIHANWKRRVERGIKSLNCLKWKQDRFIEILDNESRLLRAVIGYKDDFDFFRCEAYEIFAVEVVNKYLSENKKFVSKRKWEKKYERE